MKRPVFVVGYPRSGTTLLYSMLLAAGGFAFYRKETHVFALTPRFRRLTTAAARERFLQEFLGGYLGKVPGLDVEPMARRALAEARTPGEFLPGLMAAITRAQHMERWVEATPVHVLHLREIHRAIPEAMFVHVIRDGRDSALSIVRQRWAPRCAWDRRPRVDVAALCWEWMVRAGRRAGRNMPGSYLEVRFEDLIRNPQPALARIGTFIEHDLAYDRILQNGVHALKKPNSSFRDERGPGFDPVGRWRRPTETEHARVCERVVGPYLQELGYALAYPDEANTRAGRTRLTRAACMSYFSAKHALQAHTPLGRFLTNTREWAQQPRRNEAPVVPIFNAPAADLAASDC